MRCCRISMSKSSTSDKLRCLSGTSSKFQMHSRQSMPAGSLGTLSCSSLAALPTTARAMLSCNLLKGWRMQCSSLEATSMACMLRSGLCLSRYVVLILSACVCACVSLSVCLSVYLSVCLSVCVSVCMCALQYGSFCRLHSLQRQKPRVHHVAHHCGAVPGTYGDIPHGICCECTPCCRCKNKVSKACEPVNMHSTLPCPVCPCLSGLLQRSLVSFFAAVSLFCCMLVPYSAIHSLKAVSCCVGPC